jgi:hypothetical protein
MDSLSVKAVYFFLTLRRLLMSFVRIHYNGSINSYYTPDFQYPINIVR